jgi:imidazolonepropionase-like amidohydrolase
VAGWVTEGRAAYRRSNARARDVTAKVTITPVGSCLVAASWRVRAVRLPDGEAIDAGVTPAGRWAPRPPPDAEMLPGRFVLPGLVDAHCHLSVGAGNDGPAGLGVDAARAAAAQARAEGVTGIRDVGSPGSVTLKLLPDDGGDLVACGRFLAPEGRYFRSLYSPVSGAELVPAALADIAAGARWVKLIGDSWPDRAGPADPARAVPTYQLADVRRLADAVHAAGGRVAVHTTSRYVRELIDAGVDSVEHGYGLDEAGLAALAERGGAWTPTLCVALGFGRGPDPEQRRAWNERRQRLAWLLPLAVRLGVTIMTGTDTFGSIPREVALMTQFGLAPRDALAAATTAARSYLGFGALADGEPADLVSFDDDPRDDPAVLAHPAAVLMRGRRVR